MSLGRHVAQAVEYATPLVFAMQGESSAEAGGGSGDDGRCKERRAQTVRALIDAKANLEVCLVGSDSQRTPLMYAVLFNQPQYIHLLLNMGADIDARDKHAHSSLWLATQAGNVEAAEHLVEEKVHEVAHHGVASSSRASELSLMLHTCTLFACK